MSFIETERLFLRTWMPGDVDEALEMYGDPAVTQFTPIGKQTRETLSALIARMMAVSESGPYGFWPAIEKSTGALIGACGLIPEPGGVALAYLLKRSAWGKGYASEAARAVLAYGFGELKLGRIVAFVELRNARSIAVMHRIGMAFDRVVRLDRCDLMRYTIKAP